MSWTQALNDVTARISAASQNLQTTLDPYHHAYSASTSTPTTQQCSSTSPESWSSSMSVRVLLDHHDRPFYTNLEVVTGRVVLSLQTDTAISAINVKLEGESKTRLSGPKFQNDPRNRQKVEFEVHKSLYKVQQVFPVSGATQDAVNVQFTLPPGQYTYPFSIKFPVNNDCTNNSGSFQELRLGPLSIPEFISGSHVKQTLPPTLVSFPGEAEIKYFVKATVVRPKFYQENIRSIADILFRPIESPRPPDRQEEAYARRQHQFQASHSAIKSSRNSIFKKATTTATTTQQEQTPLAVKVEARLPGASILVCNEPLPLKILVEKTNDSPASPYLSLLQLELIGYTNIRAHSFTRTETGSWVLMSQANMKLPLDNPLDPSARSFQVPSRFWENIPLPDTVQPSFKTCNISRSYELEVRVGITHGTVEGIRPELIVLPLRLQVQVYSGIPPPPQLLSRISTQPSPNSTLFPRNPTPKHKISPHQHSPMTPHQDQGPSPSAGSYSPYPQDDPNDLPPSYEDAIAEDVVAIDGPRRESPSPSNPFPSSAPLISTADAKSASGLNRHPSERLFSQNAPRAPTQKVTPTSALASTVQPETNSAPAASAETGVIDSLAELNMDEIPSSAAEPEPPPPPLPARKGTADSVSNLNSLNPYRKKK